jgi:hypothetical protein
MRDTIVRRFAVIIIALPAFILGVAPQRAAAEQCYTFPQTGKTACGRFLDYWIANGGLERQGYPISDAFQEVNPSDGQRYLTQYFERARFEYHPENAAPYDVLLGLLGAEQFRARYPGTYPGNTPGAQLTGPGAICKPEPGYCIYPEFYRYWAEHGGLGQFGLALSFPFFETNPIDGQQYPTVYFERARFELHSRNAQPYVVQLGLLGVEQYRARYPDGVGAP